MILRRLISTLAAILPLALLLTVGACDDVPIDAATYFSDTLSEPLIVGTDTLVPDFNSTRSGISWRLVWFEYLRKLEPNDPRRQRKDTIEFIATDATAELDTIPNGNRSIEVVRVSLLCRFPRRVRESSVADDTGEPTNLGQLEIEIPKIEIVRGKDFSEPLDLEGRPGNNEGKAWAKLGTTMRGVDYPISTSPQNQPRSEGQFTVKGIDRRHRLIFASATFNFKIEKYDKVQRIPLSLDMTLSY